MVMAKGWVWDFWGRGGWFGRGGLGWGFGWGVCGRGGGVWRVGRRKGRARGKGSMGVRGGEIGVVLGVGGGMVWERIRRGLVWVLVGGSGIGGMG